jgi:hypothetical protein
MTEQRTFADAILSNKRRTTRRERLLTEMDQVTPLATVEALVRRTIRRRVAVGAPCRSRRYCGEHDRDRLEARGVPVQFRASLEQDLQAMHEFEPDLAIGTTPVVQKAKELMIPALCFTNLVSARPLMGPAGAGSPTTLVDQQASRLSSSSVRMLLHFR